MASPLSNAPRDGNGVPSFLVTRSDDGIFPMTPFVDPVTGKLLVEDGTTGTPSPLLNADRDGNFHPVFIAVSSEDFETPIPIQGNFTTGAILVKST